MIRPGFIPFDDAPMTTALLGSSRFPIFIKGRPVGLTFRSEKLPTPSTATSRPSGVRSIGFISNSSSVYREPRLGIDSPRAAVFAVAGIELDGPLGACLVPRPSSLPDEAPDPSASEAGPYSRASRPSASSFPTMAARSRGGVARWRLGSNKSERNGRRGMIWVIPSRTVPGCRIAVELP